MSTFLIGAAFAILLTLAIATVITGVLTALKISPPPPITCRGCQGRRTPIDGTPEKAR
ncbi:hypothetical protein ACFP3U_29050 [Kitasatospora misakiensis]|uniref:Uncharacterized protein n=1 Tax=Kitasatospora misakiensis TaxID=67330 RepID=A0ABW0XBB1_9ACTN